MDLAAYLGTVAGMVTLAVGGMGLVVALLGKRIDDVNLRIDDLAARMGRLESQNDAILGAVGDLGQRVAHLEARGS